jgi:protein-tyrosine phosphatase
MPLAISTIPDRRGGRIGICRLPGRDGMLASDVAAIAAWSPRLVLSLATRAEMDAWGAGGLGDLLALRQIGWLHFPVQDYGVPDAEASARWPGLAARLHEALGGGDGVLLHCLGGRGRSGMIALRLMVERGGEPEAALTLLRSAVPGAVETPAQYAWADAERTRAEHGGG